MEGKILVTGWLVLDPKGDRPYFWNRPPSDLERRPGMEVHQFTLEVPSHIPVDTFLNCTNIKPWTPPTPTT